MLAVAGTLAAPALARAANPEPTVHPPCDLFVPSVCLLPFPNDFFTVADPSTATGQRLDLRPVDAAQRARASRSTRPT